MTYLVVPVMRSLCISSACVRSRRSVSWLACRGFQKGLRVCNPWGSTRAPEGANLCNRARASPRLKEMYDKCLPKADSQWMNVAAPEPYGSVTAGADSPPSGGPSVSGLGQRWMEGMGGGSARERKGVSCRTQEMVARGAWMGRGRSGGNSFSAPLLGADLLFLFSAFN